MADDTKITSRTEPLSQSNWVHPHFDIMFQTISDGVLVVNGESKIISVNPAFGTMFGQPPEDLIGKTTRQVFGNNQPMMNLVQREGIQRLDVRLPRRRLAQGIAHSLDNGERIIILNDVTEKRDLETRRDSLSRAIAHDLRNPISALTGYADLIDRFGELNDNQNKYLKRLRQTTKKLHEMIESLVGLAWIEAGMPLKYIPIQLEDAIQKAIDEIKPLARERRVGIASSIQRPLSPIMGDPDRIHIVIYHLLENAILYSNEETNIVIHAWGDTEETYCSVADRGIGIDDSELEMIFDRMYRSKDSRVADVEGGGIGLTLAKTIISRHGGDIWASSNLNQGSTFTFVLPAVY